MINIRQVFLYALLLDGTAACTPTEKLGVVVMRISDQEVHLRVDNDNVTPGTQFDLYRRVCRHSRPYNCVRKQIGSGSITEVFNNYYSAARIDSTESVREGDTIKLHSSGH